MSSPEPARYAICFYKIATYKKIINELEGIQRIQIDIS